MTPRLWAAVFGTCIGALIWWLLVRVLHPRRSPQARLAAYLDLARANLGGTRAAAIAPLTSQAMRSAFGPMLAGALVALRRLILWQPPVALELALRQAGHGVSPEEHRRSVLRWCLVTPMGGALVGVATGRAVYVVVFFIVGCFVGARRPGERLRAQTKRRNEDLRADLPTVACVLAVKVDNNRSLGVAVAEVVDSGTGPVVEDLARALNLAHAGFGEARAFELIACEAAEPAARRLYAFLSAATSGGLDLSTALLEQANEVRQQRREDLERTAARRQVTMVLPNLVFMTPVLFMFLLAPLPSLLFGG